MATATQPSTSGDADEKKFWTIAVFMVGGPELGPAMNRDLMELERAGSSDQVNVIVAECAQPTSPATFSELPPRTGPDLASRKTVGGSTKAELDDRLADFLTLAVDQYKARHYALIMWGHASGFLFGQLKQGSPDNQLRLQQLAALLQVMKDRRGGRKVDILGFCACALSKAEFALELRGEAQFLVSSQVGISTLMTWPFDDIVQLALSSPSVEPASLARQMVQCFEEAYEPPPVGLTALDLDQSDDLSKHVNELSKTIIAALDEPDPAGRLNNLCVLKAFTEALDAHPYDNEPIVDFFDLCRRLAAEKPLDVAVRKRARKVLDNGFRSFVVENARSGPKLAALHGLSILAPDLDDPNFATTYANCSKASKAYLWQNTEWAEMVGKVHKFAMSRNTA